MRIFTSEKIDDLVSSISQETDTGKRKEKIEAFYKEHIDSEISSEISNYLGKWLTRFFFIINSIVIGLIIVFALIDIIFHIQNPEKRFIDGTILAGLITVTIAEAVAAFIIFTKFVFK